MRFRATIRFYKDTIVHFVTNTHFTSSMATCRSGVPRTLPGGSSEVDCFKSSRQSVAPPNDQSSFRTSSQISSINRRYAISIISNAISQSSLSVASVLRRSRDHSQCAGGHSVSTFTAAKLSDEASGIKYMYSGGPRTPPLPALFLGRPLRPRRGPLSFA
jgi:hypothetical protein